MGLNYYLKVALKLVASVVASAIAFATGFVAVGSWYDRTVMPEMLKKYPHDGQIGLGTFVAAEWWFCVRGNCVCSRHPFHLQDFKANDWWVTTKQLTIYCL